MKKSYIDKILEEVNIPIEIIKKNMDNIMLFPIYKLSQKTIINHKENNEEQITNFICSKCNHRFTVIGEVEHYQKCPQCANKNSTFNSPILTDISNEFNFSKNISIEMLKINEDYDVIINDLHYIILDNNEEKTTSTPFVLNKHNIDNITFFTLVQYKSYFAYNKITGEKKWDFVFTGDFIVFSNNEIVCFRNGKKSNAHIDKIFMDKYDENKKLILTKTNLLNEFEELLQNYKIIYIDNNPITKCTNNGLCVIDLYFLDSLYTELNKQKPVSKLAIKRQEFINSIISNIPELQPFEIENKNIYYKILETDEIAKIQEIEYICPYCGKCIKDKRKKYYSYNDIDVKPLSCDNCGGAFRFENFKDFALYNNRKETVICIHNYEDGIIVFDAIYNCKVENNKEYFIPSDESYKPKNIIIIKNNIDDNNLLKNVVILKKDENKDNYVIAKNLKPILQSQIKYINNKASNFNMQWSAVENLMKINSYIYGVSVEIIAGFILLYQKYPVIEKFAKENQITLLCDLIVNFNWENCLPIKHYNLNKQDVASALGISKNCVKILNDKEYNDNKIGTFHDIQLLYQTDNNITKENFKYIKDNFISSYKIADVCRKFNFSIHQVCEYLERVRINQCLSPSIAMNEWNDYLEGCKTIGSDLSDRRVKYPAALRTEHDKVMYKKKIIDDTQYEKRFKEVTNEYGKKYSYQNKDFLITYPKTLKDLFEEGRQLNHCVGSYGDIIRSGKSIILFVRKAKEPNIPFFTLEVEPNYRAIVQFYGYSDTKPHKIKHKNLILFIQKWATKHNLDYRP